MKSTAIALTLFVSLLVPAEGFEASGSPQTDWYSRGIVRQQTIKLTTKQKKQQKAKRKRRRAHTAPRVTKR